MHRVGRRLERLEDFRFEGRLHECIEFNVCHAADAAQAAFFPASDRTDAPGGASTFAPTVTGCHSFYYKYLLSLFVLHWLHFRLFIAGFTGIKSSYNTKACDSL